MRSPLLHSSVYSTALHCQSPFGRSLPHLSRRTAAANVAAAVAAGGRGNAASAVCVVACVVVLPQ